MNAEQTACTVEGCDKRRVPKKRICAMHKSRRVRGGDFLAPPRLVGSLADRFWPKVRPAPAEACWEWMAAKTKAGYGVTFDGKKTVLAHRAAYEMLRVEIPVGLQLDHLCRNRSCVNPWHLEPVTNRVNTLRGARTDRSMEASR